jgi:hypothetical protein
MANEQRPPAASVFDDLLAQSKRRFDDLYRPVRPDQSERAAAPFARAAPFPAIRGGKVGGTLSASAPSVGLAILLEPSSPVARRLTQMFGDHWRYEIEAQERHGDEAIVRCKLIFGKAGAVRTQFGRAKVSQKAVLGASDSIRFKLGADASGEREAFIRATEAALMNCIGLI